MKHYVPRFVRPIQRRFAGPPQHLIWVQERLRANVVRTVYLGG